MGCSGPEHGSTQSFSPIAIPRPLPASGHERTPEHPAHGHPRPSRGHAEHAGAARVPPQRPVPPRPLAPPPPRRPLSRPRPAAPAPGAGLAPGGTATAATPDLVTRPATEHVDGSLVAP